MVGSLPGLRSSPRRPCGPSFNPGLLPLACKLERLPNIEPDIDPNIDCDPMTDIADELQGGARAKGANFESMVDAPYG